MIKANEQIPPITNYDPICRFLTKILRQTPLRYGILILVADILVDGWIGWRYNVFFTTSGPPGLLQDFMALAVDFVMNPILAGLYLWTTVGTTRLFRQLHVSTVFKSDKEFKAVVDESRSLFLSPVIFYIALIASLLFTIPQIAAYYRLLPWKTVGGYIDIYPSISFARAPFWFLIFYAMVFGMFNVGITVVTLRKMFRTKEIQLLPLHPDRCGGLGSISQYSVKIAYALGSTGLVISAATVYEIRNGTLQDAYPVILGIVGYIIFAPIFFFWPLGTARLAMQEAKDKEILILAKQFHQIYEQVKHDAVNENSNFKSNVEKLEDLKKLYQIASEFPVWPFDIRNLQRFFTIVTAPLIPAIVSIVTEILQKILLQK